MKPLIAPGLGLLLLSSVAAADTFGGISGNEKVYLDGPARVCQPLIVHDAAARGTPACKPAAADELAALSVKTPTAERGAHTEVVATAKGRMLTIADKNGAVVVAWEAPDPIGAVVDVWRSAYGKIVVVEYTVRRAGRESHSVVGFDLGTGGSGGKPAPGAPTVTPTAPAPSAEVKKDPVVEKAAARARKTSGKAALAAWGKVLQLDPEHAEAAYRLAVAYVQSKRPADAVAQLEALARSTRPDAVEWRVAARFDKAFGRLIADPKFRVAVGFDHPGTTPYERLMGSGGQWEQALTPCDRPEMKLWFVRDRSFRLELKSTCQGQRDSYGLRGTWAQTATGVELHVAGRDGKTEVAPCQLTPDGDEDVLRCQVDDDLSFEGRPVRR
jgi:hypothetical protein